MEFVIDASKTRVSHLEVCSYYVWENCDLIGERYFYCSFLFNFINTRNMVYFNKVSIRSVKVLQRHKKDTTLFLIII